MNLEAFTVHDASAFPLVRLRPDAMQPGYAPRWEIEMNALLKQERPFVVIFPTLRSEESHDDRKLRGIWLKRNKQLLGERCLSLISVEPDTGKRFALKAQAAMAEKAFGIPAEIVASDRDAESLARQLLAAANASE